MLHTYCMHYWLLVAPGDRLSVIMYDYWFAWYWLHANRIEFRASNARATKKNRAWKICDEDGNRVCVKTSASTTTTDVNKHAEMIFNIFQLYCIAINISRLILV